MAEELNVETAVEGIASEIGITAEASTLEDTETTAADTGSGDAGGQATSAADGGAADTAAVAARPAPKAWAKEQHERWAKLDKDTQDYIEQRERQMLDGLTQYSDAAKFAKAVKDVIAPHMELIKAQNISPDQAIGYLFNAHKQLSTGSAEQRIAYLAEIAKTYGLDISKAVALAGGGGEEPAYVKELKERTSALEAERRREQDASRRQSEERIAKEVSAFAEAKDDKGNAKHPYFDECAEDIVALINAGHTLEKAYEKAVYANPVTREKEIARLSKEREAALRAQAAKDAQAARHASRTNVTSRDTGKEPTAPKGKKWEDTLDETMREIKERTTH